eukprot:scaffold35104_cov124-Isochrysis_galbana.AAC.1
MPRCYCIRLAGAPISYASKRQQCIALSSTDAEIMAASAAATEVAYLREIFRDLGLCQTDPTELYVDNTGAEMRDACQGTQSHESLTPHYPSLSQSAGVRG